MSSKPPIPNIWHLRTVADTSAKNCIICFKPSTAVLITPDNKDFFYVCQGHLKDKGFASPLDDSEGKKKVALKIETEKLQEEYRQKIIAREKKAKDKEKSQGLKEKNNVIENGARPDEDGGKGQVRNNDTDNDVAAIDADSGGTVVHLSDIELPRIYALQSFYQMRIDRIRKGEIARLTRERLGNPSLFPSVPSGLS